MTCSANDIKLLLTDFATGELTQEEAASVERHLLVCPECRNLVAETRKVLGLVDRYIAEESKKHISLRQLLDYVDNPENIDSRAAEAIENHLLACNQCREEYEGLAEVHSVESPELSPVEVSLVLDQAAALPLEQITTGEFTVRDRYGPRSGRISSKLWRGLKKPALAYSTAAVAVAALVWVLLFRLPQIESLARMSAAAEREPVFVLTEMTRSAVYVPVKRTASQPDVRLAVHAPSVEAALNFQAYSIGPSDTTLRPPVNLLALDVSVRRSDGKYVVLPFKVALPRDQQFAQFVLPLARLADGKYLLEITARDTVTSNVVGELSYPFELITVSDLSLPTELIVDSTAQIRNTGSTFRKRDSH